VGRDDALQAEAEKVANGFRDRGLDRASGKMEAVVTQATSA